MATADDTPFSTSPPHYNLVNRIGKRYGRWLVLARGPNHLQAATWLCRCDCGTERIVPAYRLGRGRSQSCGCAPHKRVPILERFFSYVQREPSGCWLWIGMLNNKGYGTFYVHEYGNKKAAHIFSYEHFVGPVPEGLELDHLCRMTRCVNYEHLEPVTHKENMHRGVKASRAHCAEGHPFSGDNLIIDNGTRRCRICRNRRKSDREKRKRQAARLASTQAV